jgi:hypothetical protein
MELELNVRGYGGRDTGARMAMERLGGKGYLKEDGSINGFEIVTHPMSYLYALKKFPWELLEELNEYMTPNNAGIHVHVSRAGFTDPAHTYRWLKFFYRHPQRITNIARRSGRNWASWRRVDRQNAKWYCKPTRMPADIRYEQERYSAVNVLNAATFEVRVFASSLDVEEVKAALGLVSGTVEYTRGLTAHKILKHKGWTWTAFNSWVREREEYQALANQMDALVPAQFNSVRRIETTCVC